MKLSWEIEPRDVQRLREFVEQQRSSAFVETRIRKNVEQDRPPITRDVFWHAMVACLLTTQQRSGPESAVTRFANTNPFPLAYQVCKKQPDLKQFIYLTLSDFGGVRRTNVIAREVAYNNRHFDDDTWKTTQQIIEDLHRCDTVASERNAARLIAERYKGFGPKQSRNLLQVLGLTRYEIPIDSRITKWLGEFGFPLKLSAAPLSDPHYYEFIMDGIQQMCAESGIYPCVLDAAIFASFDDDSWTEENAIW